MSHSSFHLLIPCFPYKSEISSGQPKAQLWRFLSLLCLTHLGVCTAHVSLSSYLQGPHNEQTIHPNVMANDLRYNFLQPCLSCSKSDYRSPMFYSWWFMWLESVFRSTRFVLPAVVGPGKGAAFLLLLMSPVHKDPKCMLVCLQVIIRRNKNY